MVNQMYLVDNNTGGTVYVFPLVSQVTWTNSIGVTPMPIPLQQVPLLLNFGGATPTVQVTWVITDTENSSGTALGDWNVLMNTINWGGSSTGWTLFIPPVSSGATISVSGFAANVSLTYTAGAPNKIDASMTFNQGTVI